MRCMLMIAPYRARVQYSAVTTASPFLHLSTTLGIPPPQSRAIRELHGHRRPSTPVHGRGHPSTAVTAVHGRQQLFISVHGRHGCPWPSTAVTAVHGHHCRPWLPTTVTAAHGCRPAGYGRPWLPGRCSGCVGVESFDWLTRVILKMITRCRPFG